MDLHRPFQAILLKRLLEPLPLLQVLLGPRQVGKTTAATQIFQTWQGAKLMVSADAPIPLSADWIRYQWQQAKNLGEEALLIIDEIQKVPGWSEQIKILFDAERRKKHLRVLLLGSSSLNLQKGLSESLAGRFELSFAPHWSFAECSAAFGWDFKTYLKFGGYPGAQPFIGDVERWRQYILNSIIEPVLGRDILGQVRIDKPALFRQCFELIAQYPAQEVSLAKLLGQLQDRGNATTIKYYLNLFEQTYLIRSLTKYSGSQLAVRASSPKILILNNALTHAWTSPLRIDIDPVWYGRVFEATLGAQLAQIPNSQLFYWREGNAEVDFVLKTGTHIYGIEIKSGVRQTTTRGLETFSKKYPKAKCLLWAEAECMAFLTQKMHLE